MSENKYQWIQLISDEAHEQVHKKLNKIRNEKEMKIENLLNNDLAYIIY